MSDEELEPARDPALAEALHRLPAPPLPEGLAERIVRNAIRHPQQAAPFPVADAPGAPDSEPAEAQRSGAGRCLRYGSVAVIALGMIAALTLSGRFQPSGVSVPHPAPPRPAVLAPAPVAASAPSAPAAASAQAVARKTKPGPSPAAEQPLPEPPLAALDLAERAAPAAPTVPPPRSGETAPAAGSLAGEGDEPAQPALADTARPEPGTSPPQGAPAQGLGISGGMPRF